jgi:uncharacterized protein YndB with AHSA1/START domain
VSDQSRVTVRVAAPRALAFDVFTREIDAWWRHGKRFRTGEPSRISLEPRCGGRLRETVQNASGPAVWELGEVRVWEPPARLVIAWRAVNFEPEDPSTEVEVRFERAIGHSGEGTLVTIEHRGFSRLRPDHPVRHGEPPRAFIVRMAGWWADLAASLREHIARDPGPRDP